MAGALRDRFHQIRGSGKYDQLTPAMQEQMISQLIAERGGAMNDANMEAARAYMQGGAMTPFEGGGTEQDIAAQAIAAEGAPMPAQPAPAQNATPSNATIATRAPTDGAPEVMPLDDPNAVTTTDLPPAVQGGANRADAGSNSRSGSDNALYSGGAASRSKGIEAVDDSVSGVDENDTEQDTGWVEKALQAAGIGTAGAAGVAAGAARNKYGSDNVMPTYTGTVDPNRIIETPDGVPIVHNQDGSFSSMDGRFTADSPVLLQQQMMQDAIQGRRGTNINSPDIDATSMAVMRRLGQAFK